VGRDKGPGEKVWGFRKGHRGEIWGSANFNTHLKKELRNDLGEEKNQKKNDCFRETNDHTECGVLINGVAKKQEGRGKRNKQMGATG